MTINTTKITERIYALDAVRAIMMLLGIVLHSAVTYAVADRGEEWPLKDTSATSLWMDVLSSLIHTFRMPVFFIVAGFFGALLYFERSPSVMFVNRWKRIVLPFAVFLLLLWPFIALSFLYTLTAFDIPIPGPPPPQAGEPFDFSLLLPTGTFHLWFLYYLIMITIATAGLEFLLNKLGNISVKLQELFGKILMYWWLRIFIWTGVVFLYFYCSDTTWADTSTKFLPSIATFIFYWIFYWFGWQLFQHRDLLPTLQQGSLWMLCLATGIHLLQLHYSSTHQIGVVEVMAINALTVWLFCFGIIGVFLKYFNTYSFSMRYISDASYWVYLVHLPMTIFLPGVLSDWQAPAVVKFLIVGSLTTVFCFVTYHYIVRNTFIGKFLNGRKYPPRIT